jgi:carbon storage regulator CsrA
MLVLTRKLHQIIRIGPDIVVSVEQIDGRHQCRIGITAPPEVVILRGELVAAPDGKGANHG